MKDKVILDREYTNQLRGFAMLIILFGHISGFFNQLNFAFIDNRYFTPLGGGRNCNLPFSFRISA